MNTYYSLWENTTANMLGDFDTKEEVFAYLRKGVADVGRSAMSTLILVHATDEDDADIKHEEFIAEGLDLLDLAETDLETGGD